MTETSHTAALPETDHADQPADPTAGLTPDEQAEARRYGRVSLALTLADMALDLVYLGVMALVFARPLDAWLATFLPSASEQSYVRLLLLYLAVMGLHILVSLPLSFYSGFVVEHKFGLSNQTLRRWFRNWALGNVLAVILGAVLNLGLFWILWNTGSYWWLITAGAFFVVSVVLGQLAPVLIVPLFYKVEPIDNPDLLARLTRLADRTGLTIEGVYRLGLSADTSKANAMLAGLGRTRRVLMGDTLLDKFTPEEIEVIFAHEIGHHVHRHIPKMIASGLLFSLLGFWVLDRVLVWWADIPAAADAPTSSLPLVMFTLGLFMTLLSPLQNAISRHFERQCDRYALVRTGNHAAYRSAFMKLAKLNKADPDPNPIEVLLLHSHPPIKERLALADR
ncbi:MAG TPA: M48 family metallopeptidase [Lacipirellulaceae bacterium]|nr:M48 family metallopeptidase [Lacipirellulaceae bacterium]